MKVIRHSLFESNSSSTHSLSLDLPNNRPKHLVGLLPSEEPYVINYAPWVDLDPENSIDDKLYFMVEVLLLFGEREKLDRYLDYLSRKFGREIVYRCTKEGKDIEPIEEGDVDAINDAFSWFREEEEETAEAVKELFKDVESMEDFICSAHSYFYSEHYYDG